MLYFPQNSCNIFPVILVIIQLSRSLHYYHMLFCSTCNSPGHDIKRPFEYFFSLKFISLLSINSCYHSNDRGCSDREGLANRIN